MEKGRSMGGLFLCRITSTVENNWFLNSHPEYRLIWEQFLESASRRKCLEEPTLHRRG
jgi:hypothetical protein